MFFIKWLNINDEIDTYLNYFKKEWIDSAHCKWFEGAALFVPSHNNDCEAGSKTTIHIDVLFQYSRFLACTFKMVRNWSEDRVKMKFLAIKIEDETWEMVYKFFH